MSWIAIQPNGDLISHVGRSYKVHATLKSIIQYSAAADISLRESQITCDELSKKRTDYRASREITLSSSQELCAEAKCALSELAVSELET